MHRNVRQDTVVVSKKNRLRSNLGLIITALAIFGAGWLVGSGNLTLQKYSPVSRNGELPDRLDYSSIDTIYNSLKDNFDGKLKEQDLVEGLKSGLARATGDPYTEYLNPRDAEDFKNDLNGTFEGIGAQLGKDADNNIIVISPISGFPAEKAGLLPRDIIAEINGESTADLTLSGAVDLIRGEKGTDVKLGLVTKGAFREVSITREKIDIPSVEHEVRDGIGILTISRFGDDTVALARKAAEEFKSARVKGVVLDLRGNPGGYLDGAVDISSLWLETGTPVLTERRDNVVIKTFRSRGNPVLKGTKTIILINEGSASASEIVAGALKDNSAATLLGQTTFGKGSVQQPINLRDGGILKITIARWFTPQGNNIDKEGIEPDEKIEISAEDITNSYDPQLETALSHL